MTDGIAEFLDQHPALVPGASRSRPDGVTYAIKLPDLPEGREIAFAGLFIPRGFPDHDFARIILSQDTVLKVPHVERSCALCTDGDPGPGYGLTPNERIENLIDSFHHAFLSDWAAGKLDQDFEKEALNYWAIRVNRARSELDPVRRIWTVNQRPQQPSILKGVLVLPERMVIIPSADDPLSARLIRSLGDRAKQQISVLVADIPIPFNFTPSTWPRNNNDIYRILDNRLDEGQNSDFKKPKNRRSKNVHRVVLLRSPEASFAFLMPGGPAIVVERGRHRRAYPPPKEPLPLEVERLDPSWTEGRDQHPEVIHRQSRHVLVLGAGALGSYVIDHLAKAGIGRITVVDPDVLTPPNLGRHLLGSMFLGHAKAVAIATYVGHGHPATQIAPASMKAETWLEKYGLGGVDAVLDLTGEPDVRWQVDQVRLTHPCLLLIGWMEPFVAAAHACTLPPNFPWMVGYEDRMGSLEAVKWPEEVIRQEPGCSSRFQSYTAAAAAHAVALIVEKALAMIDGEQPNPRVTSWVRGQSYLDKHCVGLSLLEWAKTAAPHDGLVIERHLL